MLVEVKCDECAWSKEEQDPLDWYNKKCPKCSDAIIIDRKDMDAYVQLRKLREKGIYASEKKRVEKQGAIRVNFDSSKTFTCFKCGKKVALGFKSSLQKDVCIFCDFGISKK